MIPQAPEQHGVIQHHGHEIVLADFRGDLLSALLQLDKEDDVNKVLRYFSYEHFYVIYCKVCFQRMWSSNVPIATAPDCLA